MKSIGLKEWVGLTILIIILALLTWHVATMLVLPAMLEVLVQFGLVVSVMTAQSACIMSAMGDI